MDCRKEEVSVVEKIAFNSNENSFPPLLEFQLALVGGGCGEIIVG